MTNPSLLQLEIARNQRIVVPDGHTYVRPHYRGGGENQLIYRSRSAMQLLFQAVERPEINPKEDDWFEFERMTATLLEVHLGFTVLSRAPEGAVTAVLMFSRRNQKVTGRKFGWSSVSAIARATQLAQRSFVSLLARWLASGAKKVRPLEA